MSVETTAPATAAAGEDWGMRLGRWAIAKVWLGCVLSAGYAWGQHYGWPQAVLTAAATLGAVALTIAMVWLPIWTAQRPSGIALIDLGARIAVWFALTGGVVALLIGRPAVGTVAGALLLHSAVRSFPRQVEPLIRLARGQRPRPAKEAARG